jgi:hypothetical protein
MGLKGTIKADHMAVNKYQLTLIGLTTLTLTPIEVSGMEVEVGVIDLPDRTKVSGGQSSSTEFTMTIPMHHSSEIGAMEVWFQEGQDPVVATYKKAGTLTFQSITGENEKSWTLIGAWCSKRKLPDLSMEDDGEMAVAEYTICVDEVLPI